MSAETGHVRQRPGYGLPAAVRGHRGPHLLRHSYGLLAGMWNALALTGADLSRIRYLPDPDGESE